MVLSLRGIDVSFEHGGDELFGGVPALVVQSEVYDAQHIVVCDLRVDV